MGPGTTASGFSTELPQNSRRSMYYFGAGVVAGLLIGWAVEWVVDWSSLFSQPKRLRREPSDGQVPGSDADTA